MRLLHDNKIDGATLTPSSENATYLAANLKDTRLSRKWRTTGDEDESLLIAGSSLALEVFQTTINLAQDPEDLRKTGPNWTGVNCDTELSDEYYDDKRFTKVWNTGAATGYVHQTFADAWTTTTPSFSIIVRKGNTTNNLARFIIRNITNPGNVFHLPIDWDNYPNAPAVPTEGILHGYEWKDSKTLELRVIVDTIDLDDDLAIWCYASPSAIINEYTYWTAVQAEDLPYPTPYVNGSRAITHPDETFEMSSKFILDMKFKPWFIYNVATDVFILDWYVSATQFFRLFFDTSDFFYLDFKDGSNTATMGSQQFDDGSFFTDINQRIRILVSIDLTTGTNLGSRFIIIPLESGAKYEDIEWDGAIDAHSSTFPTLSIGHINDGSQADSQIEYIRIYAGTLVGAVADSDDADALLAEKELILDLTDLDKITASYALIAGHNLSAGASIKLQGNDFNSWNGPPLEEDMTWDSKTIVHALTEVSYPFWRLLIDDPNNADGIIKIGRPFLGTYYQVEKTFNKDFTEEPFNTDVNVYSKSGQVYTRRGYDGKQYNLNFPYWENSVKQAIEAIVETIGKRTPFFLIMDEDNLDKLPVLYCHIPDDVSYSHIVNYGWRGNISFREVF